MCEGGRDGVGGQPSESKRNFRLGPQPLPSRVRTNLLVKTEADRTMYELEPEPEHKAIQVLSVERAR